MEKAYNVGDLRTRKLLSRDEAAAYIGVSLATFQKYMSESGFPAAVRLGPEHGRGRVFINRERLDEWIDSRTGQ